MTIQIHSEVSTLNSGPGSSIYLRTVLHLVVRVAPAEVAALMMMMALMMAQMMVRMIEGS